jgi:hypothetical protein
LFGWLVVVLWCWLVGWLVVVVLVGCGVCVGWLLVLLPGMILLTGTPKIGAEEEFSVNSAIVFFVYTTYTHL